MSASPTVVPRGAGAVMASRIEPPDALDDFPTPSWGARALVEHVIRERMLPRGRVWEPACNRGYLVRGLRDGFERVYATDIYDYGSEWSGQERVVDFLWHGSESPHLEKNRVEWIISNPPFRLGEEFIERARSLAMVGCAMLVRTQFLEGGRYDRLFSKNPPSIIAQFAERIILTKGIVRSNTGTRKLRRCGGRVRPRPMRGLCGCAIFRRSRSSGSRRAARSSSGRAIMTIRLSPDRCVLRCVQLSGEKMSGRRYAVSQKIFDHPIFKDEPFTEREAFIWMIGDCAYAPSRRRVGRAVFDLRRGQLVHAYRFLASKWKWSEPRVRRFLERLKSDAMIDAQASSEATIITVCNYDEYQFGSQDTDALIDAPATRPRRRDIEPLETKKDHTHTQAPDSFSNLAEEFAGEIATIAGHGAAPPSSWMQADPVRRVQLMLDSGWRVDVMREAAKSAMRRKRDRAPSTIRYFEKVFSNAHAPGLPLPAAQLVSTNHGVSHVDTTDWRSRQSRQHQARDGLRAFIAKHTEQPADSGGTSDRSSLRLVSDA
jgi:hypothetical protein